MSRRILFWVYGVFASMLLLAVAFAFTVDRYEERRDRDSVQHWDAARGTWQEGYNWRASNRESERLRSVRVGLFLAAWIACVVCTVLSAAKALTSPIYLLAAVSFFAVAILFGIGYLMASAIGGATMIG